MAIKSLVSSAWTEIDTLKTLVSSAWTEADHANALVNSAWQEVWSASKYAFNTTATHPATTYISDGTVSADVTWGDYSGITTSFWIDGDFIAGQSYTFSFDHSAIYYNSSSSEVYSYTSFNSTTKYMLTSSSTTGGSVSMTVTPTKDATIMGVFVIGSGMSAGGKTITLSNIAINGSIVKLAS